MRRLLLGCGGLVLLAALVLLVAVRSLPADWEVQAGTTIQATPEEVFPHVADLRKWRAWSFWEQKAGYVWSYGEGGAPGDRIAAKARWSSLEHGVVEIAIVESEPPLRLRYEATLLGHVVPGVEAEAPPETVLLDDPRPVSGELVLTPVDGTTQIVWRTWGTFDTLRHRVLRSHYEGALEREILNGLAGLRDRVERKE